MKKLFTTLLIGAALSFSFQASAQYCGSSQISNCGLPTSGHGFGDLATQNSFHCLNRWTNDSLTIKFNCYTTFTAQGNTVNIKKLRIDSITNLPCGACWSTNKPTNEFLPDESGCLKIQGLTTDKPGYYKLGLYLSVATIDSSVYNIRGINADLGNVYMYIRVQNAGGSCASIDTFTAGNRKDCNYAAGIEDISTALSGLTISPNPMSGEATVRFASETNSTQTLKVINMVGSDVYSTNVIAKQGLNETTISRGNLPAGIYFLSIGNGKANVTRKFIIAE